MDALSEAQILVLIAVRDGKQRTSEIKRPKASDRDRAIAELEAAGLIATRRQGRLCLLTLTERGTVAASALAPSPSMKRSGGGSSQADRLLHVESMLAELIAAVRRIEERFANHETGPMSLAVLKQRVLDIVAQLDTRHRYGGLVPIPEIRRALGPSIEARAVDAALEALEREYAIDLNIAQSPAQIAERDAGIARPGRGLLYYVARRTQ